MDPAPRDYDDLPKDPTTGLSVPFACGDAAGTESSAGGFGAVGGVGAASAVTLDSRRVTQCALSRVCGVCGAGLGRPIAFLGTEREVGRNAFHFPPSHLECASRLVEEYAGTSAAALGHEEGAQRQIVLTAGFEFLRPGKDQDDRRSVFCPNSVITQHPVA